jgi:hypothetical protein
MPFLLPTLLALQFALPQNAPVPLPATASPQQVFPADEFALRLTPERPSMVQGGSTHFDLFIDASRPIVFSLKMEGMPPAVRPDSPKLVPGINTITLFCPPETPSGTYNVHVTILGGEKQQTQTFALEINAAAP